MVSITRSVARFQRIEALPGVKAPGTPMRTAFLADPKNSAGLTVSAGLARWRTAAELKDLETKDWD